MATTIITKYGSGAPAASDVVRGELAVDTENGRLYTENIAGSVVELGTNPAANVTFGDNVKAIFGAGSDLEILSNGTDGLIRNGNATGEIRMESDDRIIFADRGFNEVFAVFNDDDDVKLYHDGNQKLATTSTGIDVTGSVTADGLTVDGDATIQGYTNETLQLKSTNTSSTGWVGSDVSIGRIEWYGSSSAGDGAGIKAVIDTQATTSSGRDFDLLIKNSTNVGSGEPTLSLRIDANKDISFYEDTGTTAKLFWDASAESLGIGTSSPSSYNSAGDNLVIAETSGGAGITIASSTTGSGHILFADGTSGTGAYDGFIRFDHTTSSMRFASGAGVERLRIDSSGNVEIGTQATGSGSSKQLLSLVNPHGSTGAGARLWLSGTNATTRGAYIEGQARSTGNDHNLIFATSATAAAPTEAMRIDSSGNVITGSDTANNADAVTLRQDGTVHANNLQVANAGGSVGGTTPSIYSPASSTLAISTNSNERLRVDNVGNLLVGKTTTNLASDGVQLFNDGFIHATATQAVANSGTVASIRRSSTDGSLIDFYKDGTTVGSIGTTIGSTYIGGNGDGAIYFNGSTDVRPWNKSTQANADDTTDLGASNARWDDIYATNGTIQTSDRNEKQDIEALSDAEQRVAVAAKGLLRKFRWKSSVAENGDDARIHFGIIAQDLQAAFEAEGLDAGRYAMFINSTWTDEETGEERSRMGVRYSELLAFIIAAI